MDCHNFVGRDKNQIQAGARHFKEGVQGKCNTIVPSMPSKAFHEGGTDGDDITANTLMVHQSTMLKTTANRDSPFLGAVTGSEKSMDCPFWGERPSYHILTPLLYAQWSDSNRRSNSTSQSIYWARHFKEGVLQRKCSLYARSKPPVKKKTGLHGKSFTQSHHVSYQ